jgi:hypothetical protein
MLSLRHSLTKANHWCTGEDSNLRTSLGGTDLQSVGFNHSPTCAETFRAMRPITRRPADRASHSQAIFKKPADKTQHKYLFFFTINFRKSGKPRSRPRHREDYNSPEKFRMECVLEKPVAPLLRSPPPAGQCLPSCCYARCRARYWSWRRDSNPRPSDYKSDALPTELRQQLGKGAPPRKLIPRAPSRCPGQLYKVPYGEIQVQAIGFQRRIPPDVILRAAKRPEGPYVGVKHRCGRKDYPCRRHRKKPPLPPLPLPTLRRVPRRATALLGMTSL